MSTPDADHAGDVRRRFGRSWPILKERLAELYSDAPDFADILTRFRERVIAAAMARPPALHQLDAVREANPAWIQGPGQTVYSFYVDRFAGDLAGLGGRIDYFDDLGVTWLHPLALLEPRAGDSDGGFAVADYRKVDPRLGTMDALEAIAADLRTRDIGLIVDIVCNHTAREHAWACAARTGDRVYRDYYLVLPDEESVVAHERDRIDVFPSSAPGNFTYDADMGGWVWTTFYPFQWDLNYANPAVFAEMLDTLIFLASKGVQGFRLDSTPFLWKATGTRCRNLPQAYALVAAWRAAMDIVAPGVVLLAEAIDGLDEVLPFFGGDGPGCDAAYNNNVMTALWAGLADADAGIVRRCMEGAIAKPAKAVWLNYVRCHDDLIWNTLSDYAAPEDLDRWSRFYGRGEGFSSGRAFHTAGGGFPSTNGMAAALAGLDPGDDVQAPGAKRLALLYGIVHALDGWPLVYMGDEIGLGDDLAYAENPLQAGDGRWLHRPRMDWDAAARRADSATLQGHLWNTIAGFGVRARQLRHLGVQGPSSPTSFEAPEVLGFVRDEGTRPLLCVANLSERTVGLTLPAPFAERAIDLLKDVVEHGQRRVLAPWGLKWLVTP
jgi:amylosucrase